MKQQAKIIRITSWDEFKKLAAALKPSNIAFTSEKSPLSTPPLALRLVFGVEGTQYVFVDFARGNVLKKQAFLST